MTKKKFQELSVERQCVILKDFLFDYVRHRITKDPSENLRLVEDIGYDNLDVAFLFQDLEQEFNINLFSCNDDEVKTLGDIINQSIRSTSK